MDVIEKLYVRDAMDYLWEMQRLRRIKVKLLDSSKHAGMWKILSQLVPQSA